MWPFFVTVVSDRIAWPFKQSGATWATTCDISKAFDRDWHAGILHKFKSYGISGQIFGLISSFLSKRQLQVVMEGKSSHEYPLNARVHQVLPFLSYTFPSIINDPDLKKICGICDIAIYVDDTILYSKCDQASDLWQQLELAFDFEYDL